MALSGWGRRKESGVACGMMMQNLHCLKIKVTRRRLCYMCVCEERKMGCEGENRRKGMMGDVRVCVFVCRNGVGGQ